MRTLALFALLIAGFASAADGQLRTGSGGKEKAANKIAATIDKHLAKDWAENKVEPAPMATDEEFCRRVYLDLLGRIPKVSEVRGFAEDSDTDKRVKLVDALLAKPGFATNLAAHIRAAWLPETIADPFKFYLGEQYESFLRKKLAANAPIKEIVRLTLTAEVATGLRGGMNFSARDGDPDSLAIQSFYQVGESKPENLGSTISRAFLGFKVECAQCHDHPFAPYTRKQFWQFAAFFGEFNALPSVGPSFVGPLEPQVNRNRLTMPGLGKKGDSKVIAAFLDGTAPEWSELKTPRQELAERILDDKYPEFARNIANRMWQFYFGIGILDPIDEPGDANPPSHPKLLDDLAKALQENDYDLKAFIRGLVRSKAYQLTSRQTDPSQADPRRFARMNMKGLHGGQIYDSFVVATGYRLNAQQTVANYDPSGLGLSKFAYRTLFPIPGKPTEAQTSILQALTVMNGRLIADQTSLDKGETLAAIADAPFLSTEKKVEALFYATLTRKPTAEESEKFSSFIERGGPSGDKAKATADVFWVLLNSTEFLFNH